MILEKISSTIVRPSKKRFFYIPVAGIDRKFMSSEISLLKFIGRKSISLKNYGAFFPGNITAASGALRQLVDIVTKNPKNKLAKIIANKLVAETTIYKSPSQNALGDMVSFATEHPENNAFALEMGKKIANRIFGKEVYKV